MTASRWTPDFLDSMRQVGDAVTDKLIADVLASGGERALVELNRFCQTFAAPVTDRVPPAVRDFLMAKIQYPAWVDLDKFEQSVDLFYGAAVETLLVLFLKSFPQLFADAAVGEVFFRSDLFNPRTINRFLIEIAQLIFDVMQPHGLRVEPEKAQGVVALQKLRLHHSIIRHQTIAHHKLPPWDPALGVPINQEDLAFGSLALAIYNLDGFGKLAVDLTPEQQDASLMIWKIVGFHLGQDEKLQPANVAEARDLMAVIARRQFRPSKAGVTLTRQLQGAVAGFLPFPLKALPVFLMRYLMDRDFIVLLKVRRAHGWSWLAWLVFVFLKLFFRELQIFKRVMRSLSGKILQGLATAKGRQGQRGNFRIPPEIALKYGYER
jgi:hypothetical protein